FFHILKAKNLTIDIFHILCLPFYNPAPVSNPVFQFSFGKSDLLIQLFIKPEILSDSSSVCDGKIPFIQRLSFSGTNPHPDRQIVLAVTSFKLQIEVSCPLFSLISVFQKVTAHLTISRSKRIQTFRIHISVQKKRNHTLHCY